MPESDGLNGSRTSDAPADYSSLKGKGVLVTGGATGVGAAIVEALADAGAYVTIADAAATEGQRLMLSLVNKNKRVQYLYTPLPSFRSQTEAFHHAALFSPTRSLSLVVANALPPPSAPPSLLRWLAATPPAASFPAPLSPPPSAPLDTGLAAALHSAHLAFHHFRLPPLDCGAADAGRDRCLLLLAPARWVEDGAVAPGELAARAAAAGLRAVFEGLREVGREGVPAEGERVEVRVNLVAVGEEEDGGGGEVRNDGVEKNGEAKKGVEADENGEGYRECARAVVRVACDESVSGRALKISAAGVRYINI